MVETVRRLKALSETGRLRVLTLIHESGELCVCEIEDVLQMTASTASRNLRELEAAGWLQSRREGRWIYYRSANIEAEWETVRRSVMDAFRRTEEARHDLQRRDELFANGRRSSCAQRPETLETFYDQIDHS